jgi:predicted lipoprotein with Yx(FWY)xxD motif
VQGREGIALPRPENLTLEMDMIRQLLLASTLALATVAAHAGPTATHEGVMTDLEGKTLYTFDKDAPGRSNCAGDCLAKWPAFMARAEARESGNFTLVARAEGGKQWAFKGKPLYYFAGDQAAGQRNGNGIGGVWHAVDAGQADSPKASAYGSSYGGYAY